MRQARARRPAALLGLSLASLVASASMVEIFLRVFRPVAYMAPPAVARDRWRGLLHRRSSIPGLAYELAPGARGFAQGAIIETNSHGMRDSEPLDDATPRLMRIAALGDSFTFGFGVPAESTYPEVLERLLQASAVADGPRFEVLNMGVGGYSTCDEALVLRYKALTLAPKLVLIGYFPNDPETDPVQPLHAYFDEPSWWRRFHSLRLLAQTMQSRQGRQQGGVDSIRALHEPGSRKWTAVESAFRQMHSDASARGIPVILVIIPDPPTLGWRDYGYADLHPRIAQSAHTAGLDVLDLLPRFREQEPRRLGLSRRDHHLSKFGHAVAARAILDKLRSNYAAYLGL